jgi:hypothetical protein
MKMSGFRKEGKMANTIAVWLFAREFRHRAVNLTKGSVCHV